MTAAISSQVSTLFTSYIESTEQKLKIQASNELLNLFSTTLQNPTKNKGESITLANQVATWHRDIIDHGLRSQNEAQRDLAIRQHNFLLYLFNQLVKTPKLSSETPLLRSIQAYLSDAQKKNSSLEQRIQKISIDTLPATTKKVTSRNEEKSNRPLKSPKTSREPSIADLSEFPVHGAGNSLKLTTISNTSITKKSSSVGSSKTITASTKIAPATLPKPEIILPIKNAAEFKLKLSSYLSSTERKQKDIILNQLNAYIKNLLNATKSADEQRHELAEIITSFTRKYQNDSRYDDYLAKFFVDLEQSTSKKYGHQAVASVNSPTANQARPRSNSNSSMTVLYDDTEFSNPIVTAIPAHSINGNDNETTVSRIHKKTSKKAADTNVSANRPDVHVAIDQVQIILNKYITRLEKEKAGFFCLFYGRKTAKQDALRLLNNELLAVKNKNITSKDIQKIIRTVRENFPQLDKGHFSNRTGELINHVGIFLEKFLQSKEPSNFPTFEIFLKQDGSKDNKPYTNHYYPAGQ